MDIGKRWWLCPACLNAFEADPGPRHWGDDEGQVTNCGTQPVEVAPVSQHPGVVKPDDAQAIARAERWLTDEMHDGMTNREVAVGVLRAAAGGQ